MAETLATESLTLLMPKHFNIFNGTILMVARGLVIMIALIQRRFALWWHVGIRDRIPAMNKYLIVLLVFFLTGCPMGDRGPQYLPLDTVVVNNKICVFVKKDNLAEQERLLRVSVRKSGQDNNVYEKTFYHSELTTELKANECITGVSDFAYEPGSSYDINVQTPHNSYQTSFIVWMYGQNMMLK